MFKVLVIALLFMLTSCGNKLDGTYTDNTGLLKYTFKPNGKVYQSAMGIELEMPYTIDGDKIKLPVYQGVSIVLTLREDGTLISPMGVLKKQDSDKTINLPLPQKNKSEIKKQTLKLPLSQSNDPQVLLVKLRAEEDACRGGSGDDKATWAACERRDHLVSSLTKLGWCWGPEDKAEYEKSWQRCSK